MMSAGGCDQDGLTVDRRSEVRNARISIVANGMAERPEPLCRPTMPASENWLPTGPAKRSLMPAACWWACMMVETTACGSLAGGLQTAR